MSKPETIEDIMPEMREYVFATKWYEQTLKEYAGRIDEARGRRGGCK